jgi:Fe2+ or Zn2+ uptake regulation protein
MARVKLDRSSSRRLLSSAGRRVTSQRTLLLELIRQAEGHLDAPELYRLAREKDPNISLSTIYRTLAMLKELGLVDELHLAEEHHHYEAKPSAEHFHLICLGCGKVLEFESPLTDRLKRELTRRHGFAITNTSIDLTGYCPECQRDK